MNIEESRKIKHDCGNGIFIILEDFVWIDDVGEEHHEFLTYLEKDGCAWQDLTMVNLTKDNSIEIKVWDNCDSEDYTVKFTVGIHEEN